MHVVDGTYFTAVVDERTGEILYEVVHRQFDATTRAFLKMQRMIQCLIWLTGVDVVR